MSEFALKYAIKNLPKRIDLDLVDSEFLEIL
jgi:hypothetical protein